MTACLSVCFSEVEELQFIIEQMKKKQTLEEEQRCYLSPRTVNGILQSAVMVSDGTLVRAEPDTLPVTTLEPAPHCEEELADPVQTDVLAEAEVGEQVEREVSLVPEEAVSSDLAEEVGDQVESNADSGESQELMLENIISEVPRTKLAETTETDPILSTARSLADSLSEGYY